jgi:ABC-type glycerol-3-phosphate transport system substrate-binding protein
MNPYRAPALVSLLIALAACSTLPGMSIPTPVGTPPDPAATQPAVMTPSAVEAPLTIWLPPAFAPDQASPAGRLFLDRVSAFQANYSDLQLRFRVKDAGGQASLLRSLAAAGSAAPANLPDIIALDPVGRTTAALKELIIPLDELITLAEAPGWYPFAVEAVTIDGGLFAVPFAADATLMVYRTHRYRSPPIDWTGLLTGPAPWRVPADDPQALFTLAQYLALEGPLLDQQGLPTLDPIILADVLSFYASAVRAGVLPPEARIDRSLHDTWAAFSDGEAVAATATFGILASQMPTAGIGAVALPTRNGSGISFAETWGWSLVTTDPERQALSLALIDWLTEAEFLGRWTQALGLIPARAEALQVWTNGHHASLASRLIIAARPMPGEEVSAIYGPILRHAVQQVMEGGVTPEAAALHASQQIRAR